MGRKSVRHQTFMLYKYTDLTLSGLGGGVNCPPNLWEAQKQKLFEWWSITSWQFLNMYILWLQTKKNWHLYSDRRAERGFKFSGQDILCLFLTYLYCFWVLSIFYHVRCLNILNLSHWFNFWGKKKLKHFDCCLISER